MAVDLKAVSESAFTNIWLPAVNGGVTVVNGTTSTQGIQDTRRTAEMGLALNETPGGVVTVISDNIGTLEFAGEISVDGVRVWVSDINPDVAKGLTRIEYTESQPVPESML